MPYDQYTEKLIELARASRGLSVRAYAATSLDRAVAIAVQPKEGAILAALVDLACAMDESNQVSASIAMTKATAALERS